MPNSAPFPQDLPPHTELFYDFAQANDCEKVQLTTTTGTHIGYIWFVTPTTLTLDCGDYPLHTIREITLLEYAQ